MFTQGEWKVYFNKYTDCYEIGCSQNGKNLGIAKLFSGKGYKDNANLIAAAPDMYKALKVALWHEENGEYESQHQGKPRYCEVLEILRNTIAKAEGEL